MSLIDALIVYFVNPVLTLLVIILIVNIVLSWLVHFDVVNPRNQLVATLGRISSAIIEPVLRPIRRILPPLGGMDFSPLVLVLVISFIQGYVLEQIMRSF